MLLKPVGKRLFVVQIPNEITDSGIHLPQSHSDTAANRYRVLAVGAKCCAELRESKEVMLHSERGGVGNLREPQLIEESKVLAIFL